MLEKKLSRRDLAKAAAVGGLAVGIGAPVCAAASGKGGALPGKKPGFGDIVVPPEQEGKEKHVPHITAPEKVKEGEPFTVEIIVGKERRHPNSTSHHIKWIQLFAKEEGKKPAVHVATFDFGPSYAEPRVTVPLLMEKTVRLYVLAYCNIHGIWDNTIKVEVEAG